MTNPVDTQVVAAPASYGAPLGYMGTAAQAVLITSILVMTPTSSHDYREASCSVSEGGGALLQVLRSGLSELAKRRLQSILLDMSRHDVVQDFGETEDGGAAIDLSREGRSISFIVPRDGTALYFVARDADYRAAGVVEDAMRGVCALADWLMNGESILDPDGLAIG